jgi:Putative beta-barrel porin 2
VRYLQNPSVAAAQDSIENTASESLSFTIVPTVSANCGAIFDTINYDQNPRGYTDFTGFVGGTWQALPNVTASLRVGGTYTETTQQLGDGQTSSADSVAPYADISGSWQIGARSSLTGDYSHETTPSDYSGSNAQESDRFSAAFSYLVTPQLSTYAQISYTYSNISGADIYLTSTTNSYTETVYQGDVGASYNFIKYFSLTFDITESGVSSGLPGQDYNREEVSVGVRGTY